MSHLESVSDFIERLNAALVGRYALERELGAGGMATVYLARDLKHDRHVALKVLRPELAAAMGTDRFLREITITAGLTHPHILPLLDSGSADGFLFYVMPFVEGESLRDRLNREKQLSVQETIRFTTEIADALASAHRRGVVHRDIKPENILLEEGHAVVADFGIARAMSAAGGRQLTETGLAIGTPAYMSPEQLSGESHVGASSDVYSLGCMAYEMLAGEPPFAGPTVQSMLARKAVGTVPSLRDVRNDVSASVEAAVMKSLAEVTSERYGTAPEFAAALLAGDADRAPARTMIGVAALVVLVVAVLAFSGLLPGTVRPAAAGFFTERDRVVVSDFDNETDQPALGLAVREAVMTDLEQSKYVNVVERANIDGVLQRMRLPDTMRVDADVAVEVARRQGYPAVVTGSVIPLGAGYQLSVRIIEASTGEVAVRLRETAAGDDEVVEAVERLTHLTRRHLGESLLSVRRSDPLPALTTSSLEALQLYARGAAYAQRGFTLEAIPFAMQAVEADTAFAAAHRALGLWYVNTGSPGLAQKHIDLAHRYNDRLHPRERYLVGSTYNSFRGRLDSTAYYYRLLLDRDPDDATANNNLGDVNERMGRYEDALVLYRRAMEVSGSSTGHLNLASAARTLGQHELADSVFQLMRERFPNVWVTWQTEASNALYAGDYGRLWQIANEMSASEFAFPRVYGRVLRASLHARNGQIGTAIALADSAARMARGVSRPFPYIALLTAQYAALSSGAPELISPYLGRVPEFDEVGTSPGFEYRMMGFVANGYALSGDEASANRLLVRMDSLAVGVGLRPAGIGSQVRASLTLNADRPTEALEYIREAREVEYGLLHNSTRLLLGEALTRLGRLEEAAAHYDTLTSTYRLNFNDVFTQGPISAIAHERAASTYLALGDTAAAVQHLATFVELWQDADQSVQPIVVDSRELLMRLVGEVPSGR